MLSSFILKPQDVVEVAPADTKMQLILSIGFFPSSYKYTQLNRMCVLQQKELVYHREATARMAGKQQHCAESFATAFLQGARKPPKREAQDEPALHFAKTYP